MIEQHRKQIETVGNGQEAAGLGRCGRAPSHQNCDFPEADGADTTSPQRIERTPFTGGEQLRRTLAERNRWVSIKIAAITRSARNLE
jgi:hypothetical protein